VFELLVIWSLATSWYLVSGVSSLSDAFVFIYCTQAGSSRAQRAERRNRRCNKMSFWN